MIFHTMLLAAGIGLEMKWPGPVHFWTGPVRLGLDWTELFSEQAVGLGTKWTGPVLVQVIRTGAYSN